MAAGRYIEGRLSPVRAGCSLRPRNDGMDSEPLRRAQPEPVTLLAKFPPPRPGRGRHRGRPFDDDSSAQLLNSAERHRY